MRVPLHVLCADCKQLVGQPCHCSMVRISLPITISITIPITIMQLQLVEPCTQP